MDPFLVRREDSDQSADIAAEVRTQTDVPDPRSTEGAARSGATSRRRTTKGPQSDRGYGRKK